MYLACRELLRARLRVFGFKLNCFLNHPNHTIPQSRILRLFHLDRNDPMWVGVWHTSRSIMVA